MADIITYKPTEGISSSERTQSGYYAAIKTWLQSIPETFEKFVDITYDDTTFNIFFKPKNILIENFYAKINFTTSSIMFYVYYGSSNSYVSYSSFNIDHTFHIYNDGKNFTLGMDHCKIVFSIMAGTSFGTGESKQIVICTANSMNICVSGNVCAHNLSSEYNRIASGITDVYRIQPMPINGTDIVFDDVYYFDGGMSSPPSGMFKVGTNRYVTLFRNVAFKLQ